MIKIYSKKLLFVLLFVLAFGGCAPEQSVEPVAPKLTPKTRELLRKEMVSINDASQEIFSALIAGDDVQVALLAQQIHDSFILKQSMTTEDKAHLMTVAPKGFVEMDKRFHEISAELAQAARAENRPLQQQQFARMIKACSACHALYGTDQFPKFVK
ncbi:MAG: cytochrome c [Alphaproteobacteria bacterium]|nr:cytochrome c [Alphaproteobacteria bacterium]